MNLLKNVILLLSLQFLEVTICYSQTNEKNYVNCVKSFYSILFAREVTIEQLERIYVNGGISAEAQQMICDSLKKSFYNYQLVAHKESKLHNNSPSFIIQQIRTYTKDLTQGLNCEQIYSLIDNAKIYNQGLDFDDYLELDFPNKKSIYFDLNRDEPTKIVWIYLSNGDLLEGKFYNNNPETLLLVGQINDPDGFVNVRKYPSTNSAIINKITNENYFYYTPNSESNWWLVRNKENESPLGYVNKSRIRNYIEFPEELKKRVEKERN